MLRQKAMKQGRNVHSVSHVMHAHNGGGHIVWVTCLLRFCLLTQAYLTTVGRSVTATNNGRLGVMPIPEFVPPHLSFRMNIIIHK